MAQSTTSHLLVSLGPPRPSVSFTSTVACSPSALSVVTACIATPVCVHSPETIVGTAVTYDIYGLPVYVCTNATSGSNVSSGGSGTVTTTSATTGAGIATASLQHTPLSSSSSTTTGTSSGTGTRTSTSSPATTQSSNPARRIADLSSTLLVLVLLSWLGIAVFNPGHL